MLDLLILAIIAVAVASRLFKVLGKNDEDGLMGRKSDDIDPIMRQFYHKQSAQPVKADIEIVSASEAALSHPVRDVLDKVRKLDPQFNTDNFYQGVKSAFVMIINAFVKNDTDVLRKLLSPEVFKNFDAAVQSRLSKKQVLSKTVLGITHVEISDAVLAGDVATLTVQLKSDQITFLRDYLGNVLDGSANTIVTSRDLWTFARRLKEERIWLLVGTGTF